MNLTRCSYCGAEPTSGGIVHNIGCVLGPTLLSQSWSEPPYGNRAAMDRIAALEAENARLRVVLAQIQAEANCTSAGPGRDAQRASPYDREAWFEMALDHIYAWADDALTNANGR